MTIVGLIPARGGSKRIHRKNIRPFNGYPLIHYAIDSAEQSGIFHKIVVSSDDEEILREVGRRNVIALHCPQSIAHKDDDPDYLWVKHSIGSFNEKPSAFAILRPTSPFRTADMIRRGWEQFRKSEVHSLRAVEQVKQHPGKMWTWDGPGMPIRPLLNERRHDGTPWHSSPTQTLPTIYVQNASLEIAWTYVLDGGTISGTKVMPFFTHGIEGFDLNTEADWMEAERIACSGRHPVQASA